jgi:hypothetical protein
MFLDGELPALWKVLDPRLRDQLPDDRRHRLAEVPGQLLQSRARRRIQTHQETLPVVL